jgi:hypothetical protein
VRPAARHVAILLIAAFVAACSPSSTPSASTASPSAAPSAAAGSCPTAADPGRPAGWGQPVAVPTVIPVLINDSAELTCGSNRVLFGLIDAKTNTPIGGPDRTVKVALYDLARDSAKPVSGGDAAFIWAIENVRGIYAVQGDFSEAGIWGAEITTAVAGAPAETIRMTFQVSPSSPVIRIGQKAPPTKTPTAADVGGDLSKISTDSKPDPALYKVSVDQALAKHEPFLLAFATPKFCVSAQCGPTLDRLKPYAAKYPTVQFIHVEPYQLTLQDGQLQPVLTGSPANLTPTDVSNTWGLLTEPWVFVVDRDGVVRNSFELIFSDAELTAALNAVK